MLALTIAVLSIVTVFTALGVGIGVKSNLPFPLLSLLTVLPTLGMVPWAVMRFHQRYAALVFPAFTVLACKLAGCVVARIVYGPDYIAQGYVSDDWHTAKLMITTMWFLTTLLSVTGFFDTIRRCK